MSQEAPGFRSMVSSWGLTARPQLQKHGLARSPGYRRDSLKQMDCSPFSTHGPLACLPQCIPLCGRQDAVNIATDHVLSTQWLQPQEFKGKHHWRMWSTSYVDTRKFQMVDLTWPENESSFPFSCTLLVRRHLGIGEAPPSNHWKPVFTGNTKDDAASWVMTEPELSRVLEATEARISVLFQYKLVMKSSVSNNSVAISCSWWKIWHHPGMAYWP